MTKAILTEPRNEEVVAFMAPDPKDKKFLEQQKKFESDVENTLENLRGFQHWGLLYFGEGVYKLKGSRPEDTRMIYPGEWLIFRDEQAISHVSVFTPKMFNELVKVKK